MATVAAVAALWQPGGGDALVIYSAMGPGGALIDAYRQETGTRIDYINMAGGPLQARLYAEGEHPRWTVAWFVGDAAMAALDGAGLLARPVLPRADEPEWTAEAMALLPPDRAYAPTGLALGGVFLTRGRPAPDRWPALAAVPHGVGLVSPVISGTAYPVLTTLMQAAGGSAPGHALLRGLRSTGLLVAATNPLLIAALERDEIGLAILPSQAAYAAAARQPGFTVTVPAPSGIVPAVIAISAGASRKSRAEARRFVDFLLTPRGQALIRRSTAEGYGWAPIEGVAPSPGLPPLASLDLVHPDPAAWGARQGEEIGWFRRELAP